MCNTTSPNPHVDMCYNASRYEELVDIEADEGFKYVNNVHGISDFNFWFEPSDTKAIALKRLQYLESRHFIDRNTKDVSFHIMLYNAELSTGIFSEVILKLNFDRAGLVKPSVEIESVFGRPYEDQFAEKITIEILFVLALLYLTISESQEVSHQYHKGMASIFHYCMDVRNVMDWTNVFVSFWIILGWVVVVIKLGTCEADFANLQRPSYSVHNYTEPAREAWDDYHKTVMQLEETLQDAMEARSFSRILCGFNLFLLTFRFVKCWHGIKELALITQTAGVMGKKLFFFSIIFFNTLGAYAFTGMFAFGARIEAFTTFTGSFSQLFVMFAMGGDSDVLQLMQDINGTFALLYYWSFIIVAFFIFFNMLLAIILQSFDKVQRMNDGDGDTPVLYYIKQMHKVSTAMNKQNQNGVRPPSMESICEYLDDALHTHKKMWEANQGEDHKGKRRHKSKTKMPDLMVDFKLLKRGQADYWAEPYWWIQRFLGGDQITENVILTEEFSMFLIAQTRFHMCKMSGVDPEDVIDQMEHGLDDLQLREAQEKAAQSTRDLRSSSVH